VSRALEVLAPAGDGECLKAAVGAGADAVYFGLDIGFNARAKATNFSLHELPSVLDYVHGRGVRAYVAFNTLVFDAELARAAEVISALATAGVDALIVQDLGIARLCHALVPELPLHASTQMTVSSPEAAALVRELGIRRVILPRELSVAEIRRFAQATDLELECFVHGALCMSYSGQCLMSAVFGQRSANRGACAQPCRMAYELWVDGRRRALGDERYLLAPKDLAAHGLVADLAAAGVSALKIEGRYKGPDYVAATVEKYRRLADAAAAGERATLSRQDIEDLAFSFCRGFGEGWLRGPDHRGLSHGRYPSHRGLLVGKVREVSGRAVLVQPVAEAPAVRAGDWMLFGQGDPEGDEQKGGVFAVVPRGAQVELRFGDPGPDLRRVQVGDELWKSHDSAVKRRLLRYLVTTRRVPIDLHVRGEPLAPLVVSARDGLGRSATVQSTALLEPAERTPLGADVLRDKLGAFGDSRFVLRGLVVELSAPVAMNPSALKELRRTLVDALEAQGVPRPTYAVRERAIAEVALSHVAPLAAAPAGALLVPLCRSLAQVEAALGLGLDEVMLDLVDLRQLRAAVASCRAARARVVVATPRIHKPGNEVVFRHLARLAPDGVLVRSLGALHYFAQSSLFLVGDFSLNVANVLSALALLERGLSCVTPAFELDAERRTALVRALPAGRVELVLHQQATLQHTEYCLYAHHLSRGHDARTCGRPCLVHRLHLRDHKGESHPVQVDIHCRNTVFSGRAQILDHALAAGGVARWRVELVEQDGPAARRLLSGYLRSIRST